MAPPIQIILKCLLSFAINWESCSCLGVGKVIMIKSFSVNLNLQKFLKIKSISANGKSI